jgi:hypothetical protein
VPPPWDWRRPDKDPTPCSRAAYKSDTVWRGRLCVCGRERMVHAMRRLPYWHCDPWPKLAHSMARASLAHMPCLHACAYVYGPVWPCVALCVALRLQPEKQGRDTGPRSSASVPSCHHPAHWVGPSAFSVVARMVVEARSRSSRAPRRATPIRRASLGRESRGARRRRAWSTNRISQSRLTLSKKD